MWHFHLTLHLGGSWSSQSVAYVSPFIYTQMHLHTSIGVRLRTYCSSNVPPCMGWHTFGLRLAIWHSWQTEIARPNLVPSPTHAHRNRRSYSHSFTGTLSRLAHKTHTVKCSSLHAEQSFVHTDKFHIPPSFLQSDNLVVTCDRRKNFSQP